MLRAPGPLNCEGVRLQPAASAAVAGDRLVEFRDRIVDLAGLDARLTAVLHAVASNWAESTVPDRLWMALQSRLAGFEADASIERAVHELDASGGSLRIAELAAQLGLPLRSFQQRFLRRVGMAAKEYARLIRLQAAIRLLDQSDQALSERALASGFSDQAHATRELRRLTGLTPARLAAALRNHQCGGDH